MRWQAAYLLRELEFRRRALSDNSARLALRFEATGELEEALGGVLTPVEQHVLNILQELLVNLLVHVFFDLQNSMETSGGAPTSYQREDTVPRSQPRARMISIGQQC